MTKTSTPNDVIRYAYGEVITSSEKKNIENAIVSNSELSGLYFEVMAMQKSLNKIRREPSQKSVDRILQFSKNFKLHPVT